ncbi:MAG: hypothetical protein GXO93_08710 [FCB group bacterium]|nr:hypothetical protein [FCB group bacterium]
MNLKLIVIFLLMLCLGSFALAETNTVNKDSTAVDSIAPPAPVTMFKAFDTPNDHGHSITLNWQLSADDGAGQNSVLQYQIYRWVPYLMDSLTTLRKAMTTVKEEEIKRGHEKVLKKEMRSLKKEYNAVLKELPSAHKAYPNNGYWKEVGKVPAGTKSYKNTGSKEKESQDYLPDLTDFYYRVDAVTKDSTVRASSKVFGPVQCSGQWFNTGRIPVLVAVILFTFLTIYFVEKAKNGAKLYVRPLSGIEAVDDAIGRATEMGRPILYILGLGSVADIATIASFTILSRVAKQVAEYQTELLVPTYDPLVMAVAQEVVKSAYLDAGRPDDYKEDTVHFVTQSQFAYVAAVNGIMLRELPATNIYMGVFFAESLILAETGALAGSIQIAGTDQIAQIPFFIVACDYTLIGEELYAASAYLGREPLLLGSLKAQDYAKALVIILAIIGLIMSNFGWTQFTDLFKVAN